MSGSGPGCLYVEPISTRDQVSEFGKLGIVCVGASPERAEALYRRTGEILDREQMAD